MTNFLRKYQLQLFILMLCPLLNGCWDQREVNDLLYVVAVGVDKPEEVTETEQVEVTIQFVIPSNVSGDQSGGMGGGGGQKAVEQRTLTGETIVDAMSKLQQETSRQIFWGHSEVIVFGDSIAKKNLHEHIDFFARYPEPRLQSRVFIVNGKARELLDVQLLLESIPSEKLKDLSSLQVMQDVTLKDFLQMLSENHRGASAPLVKKEITETGDEKLALNGTAIFKNNKMVGSINPEITRGLLWVLDEIDLATVTIQPNEEGKISFNLIRSRTTLQPAIENGKWKMTVNIQTDDDVAENGTNLNVMNPNTVKKLENLLEKDLKKRVYLTLEKVQKEMKADVFGFGDAFHKKYPKEWSKVKQRWEEKFPEVEVKVESQVKVKRPGSSTSPQGIPEEKVKE
ncbi:Ger(x)C family spore germination protein [Alteribacillus bidgolensis]|uniref:Spore germination protein KC n=1 Tax=Alteribacillus bidgolensis TaxID=930129 RepID=A0A1G8FZM8_9BACI|nr:Ger(x)C family spore germination protein [Alteribacillus bidgolensis]SDH87555.1 spore germination protein KC [Alteribacillus bidgolensis]